MESEGQAAVVPAEEGQSESTSSRSPPHSPSSGGFQVTEDPIQQAVIQDTTHPSIEFDANLTIVIEGEPGSLNLAEQTLVQEDKEEEEGGKVSATALNGRSRRSSHLSTKESWEQVPQPGHLKPITRDYSPTSQRKMNQRQFIPKSSYYFGPPGPDSAYGTAPVGQIGVHQPREILRVERDYTGGELIQFTAIYPLELEGRITPTQFLESINAINELLISAHSLRHTFFDNSLAVFSLQLSRVFKTTHFEKEMKRLQELITQLNSQLYNPVGLNILWPRSVAFLFLEIEYY